MLEITIEQIIKGEDINPEAFEGMTFKEGMMLLEEIVSRLESGDLELEESLRVYSKGVSLLADLQARLNAAEQEVEVLMGSLEEAPDDEIQDTTLLNA